MTTKRFNFSHNSADYEALGEYGSGKFFAITMFPQETSRTAGTPSGVPVLALVSDVDTKEELRAELNIKFPGLVEF
jgi:hypothetical protein